MNPNGANPMNEREDEVNWSTLKHIRTSPKHYLHALAHPRKDTDALLLGRLAHCAVYEPAAVDERYMLAPKFHRGMKDANAIAKGYHGGREAAEQFDASVGCSDVTVVPPEIWTRAMACRDAILADPIAAPMVTGGYAEQRITWTDEKTGIECRGRVDHVNGTLSDLKTAQTVEPRMFASAAARYGYHAQLAWYQNGLHACGIGTGDWPALITVESDEPHDVVVYRLREPEFVAGERVYRECLDILAECRATGQWPGLAGGMERTFELPAWASPEPEALTMGGEPLF